MKDSKTLLEKFKKMPLGKQSLIAVITIVLIISVLSNYKNIKSQSKKIINSLTNSDDVREFMDDVSSVIQNISKILNDFFKKDDIVSANEVEEN